MKNVYIVYMSDEELKKNHNKFNLENIEEIAWQCGYGSLEYAKSKNFLSDEQSKLFEDGTIVQYDEFLHVTNDNKYSIERSRTIKYNKEKMQYVEDIEEENNIKYKIKYRLIDLNTCVRYKIIQDEFVDNVVDATIIIRKNDKKNILWTGNGSNGKSTLCYFDLCMTMTDDAKKLQKNATQILKQFCDVTYEDNDNLFLNIKFEK